MQALSNVAPDTVSAGEAGSANHQNLFGFDNRHDIPKRYIYYDYPGGGGGGRHPTGTLAFGCHLFPDPLRSIWLLQQSSQVTVRNM